MSPEGPSMRSRTKLVWVDYNAFVGLNPSLEQLWTVHSGEIVFDNDHKGVHGQEKMVHRPCLLTFIWTHSFQHLSRQPVVVAAAHEPHNLPLMFNLHFGAMEHWNRGPFHHQLRWGRARDSLLDFVRANSRALDQPARTSRIRFVWSVVVGVNHLGRLCWRQFFRAKL